MKYSGGCHCGKVRYEADMAIDHVNQCNCSMCSKKGYLLAFTPEENFTLLSGEEALADYQFGKKVIHHLFCGTCGVSSFARGEMPDGTKMAAINVRCLDNVDLSNFPVVEIDGKSF